MSYTVLARKYRSANFDELVGQEHIATTLKRAIESGRIAHAYLFCGTRGTGKTSTARILAKALNCRSTDAPTAEPCGKCDSCLSIARGDDLDVIEIDAASNTGVDNVREIIENAQYRPSRSRFKVYIIDEVHMLSKSAFNALLKTLEEPPSHVKFILATTEPEKVLPTILSRCQRYDFRSISSREIAAHLREICKKEKISAEEDALALVAKAGAGSMRDALSLLDRLLSMGDKKLGVKDVEQMLGLPRAQLIFDLVDSIGGGDVKKTLEGAGGLISSGLSPDALIAALSDHLRNLLIALTCGKDSGLVDIPGLSESDLYAQAARFDASALAQDIAILEELRRNMRHNQTGRAMFDATLVRLTLAGQFLSIGPLLAQGVSAPATAVEQKKKPEPLVPILQGAPTSLWSALLGKLQGHASFSTVLGMARFNGIENDMATIRLPETFVKQWNANGKKDQIARALTELRGQPTGVRFEIDEEQPEGAVPRPLEVDAGPIVEFVLKEFGGTLTTVE
jgi:DNA polymerase-3 subunit gamma/tau